MDLRAGLRWQVQAQRHELFNTGVHWWRGVLFGLDIVFDCRLAWQAHTDFRVVVSCCLHVIEGVLMFFKPSQIIGNRMLLPLPDPQTV